MAKKPPKPAEAMPQHRGRIQAQGPGTEESVPWAQQKPPTVAEMLEMCKQLEGKLSKTELKDRKRPLENLRRFILAASERGGIDAPCSKSWLKAGSRDIRIDLEVIAGRAVVATAPETTTEENKNA